MSVFENSVVTCPVCQADVSHDVVHSVNADRRPDLRDAILDGTFQRAQCPGCGETFRLSPEFSYLDQRHRLWLAAFGAADLGGWAEAEREAQETFDGAFGAGASPAARGVGDGLTRRVTFGWPAVREKLLLREHGLDDVTVELMKAAMLREGGGGVPLNGEAELRVINVRGDILACAWLWVSTEEVIRAMEVPRAVYDGIAADHGEWADLRADLTPGFFLDLNRMLIPGAASAG